MRVRSMMVAIVACGTAACGTATEPSRSELVLETEASVIQARQDTTIQSSPGRPIVWVSMTIPVTIRNAGSRTIYFHACGSIALERRQEDGTWRDAWSPICFLVVREPESVDAGREWRTELRVSGALSGPGGPPFSAEQVAGEYRVVLYATTSAERLPMSPAADVRVPSTSFTVR